MAKKNSNKKPAKSTPKKAVKKAGKKPIAKAVSKKPKKVKPKSAPKKVASKVRKVRAKSAPKKAVLKGKKVKAKSATKKPTSKAKGKSDKGKKVKKLSKAQIINNKRKRGVNRYNAIRSAISESYLEQGKKITNLEIKEIYAWIKEKHDASPTTQIVSNIDVLITQYLSEVGQDVIDLSLFNPAVEWFGFKEVLHDELSLHKPDDLIRVDLTNVGVVDWVDFKFEDYLTGAELVYEKCKEAGIRRASPVPMIELLEAFHDDSMGVDVYMYNITAEEEFTDVVGEGETPVIDLVATPEGEEKTVIPEKTKKADKTTTTTGQAVALSPEQIVSNEKIKLEEIKSAERIKIRELELNAKSARQDKERKELLQLFREKLITLKEYTDAVKELGIG